MRVRADIPARPIRRLDAARLRGREAEAALAPISLYTAAPSLYVAVKIT